MSDRIVARGFELDAVSRFLDGIPGGPVGLAIDGPAGIGKSTLWLEAVARAQDRGIRVLTARPTEGEALLSYAALADLIDPVFPDAAGELPDPQRRALEVALLRSDTDDLTDLRTVATAVVGVVASLARKSPVLIAIDDAQCLDPASRDALAFVVRRLVGPIGLMTTQRSPGEATPPLGMARSIPEDRLGHVLPGPLSLASIHHLARERLGREIPRFALSRIVEASEGNPFYALELARSWVAEEDRSEPGSLNRRPLPIPKSLRELVVMRVQTLSEPAREVVAIAALMARPRRSVIASLVGDRIAYQGIAEALASGVIAEDGDRLRFQHPLLGTAVGDLTQESVRESIHARLATVVQDPEERALHLAARVGNPEGSVADAIETGAALAAQRGALLSAVELWHAAVRMTPTTDIATLARRLAMEAAVHLRNGDQVGARRVAEHALTIQSDPVVKVDALLVLADIGWTSGRLLEAHDRLMAAAASVGPAQQGRIFSRLAGYSLAVDAEMARVHAERALELIDGAREPSLRSYALINGFLAEVSLGHEPRLELLTEGLDLETTASPDATLSSVPLIWFNAIDDADRARARHDLEDAWYRDRGDDGWQAERMSQRALVELRAGNWDLAGRTIDASCSVLTTYGVEGAWQIAFGWRALIDAHRGETDRARKALEPMIAAAQGHGNHQWSGLMLSVLGFTEFAAGDFAATDRALTAMRAEFDAIGFREAIGDRSEAFHIEALLRLGRRTEAGRVLSRLEERAKVLPRPWTSLALPRARALVLAADGDLTGAIAIIGDIDPDARVRLPFEAAWNRLVEGQLLRRAGRRRDAAKTLAASLAVFEDLGAPHWAGRAKSDLERLGLRHVGPDELTPTERQIAELASTGLTNREVAEQAFVSPKTVEANLARAYRKLGIRSRAELGRWMTATRDETQT